MALAITHQLRALGKWDGRGILQIYDPRSITARLAASGWPRYMVSEIGRTGSSYHPVYPAAHNLRLEIDYSVVSLSPERCQEWGLPVFRSFESGWARRCRCEQSGAQCAPRYRIVSLTTGVEPAPFNVFPPLSAPELAREYHLRNGEPYAIWDGPALVAVLNNGEWWGTDWVSLEHTPRQLARKTAPAPDCEVSDEPPAQT